MTNINRHQAASKSTNNFSTKDFKFIQEIIYSNSGISMGEGKKQQVKNRLDERIKSVGVSSYAEYCAYLADKNKSNGELRELINCITINETYFLRETKPIETLVNELLPKFGPNILIWSAGCSTGEEPCTIAIHLNEYIQKTGHKINANIVASDISYDAIKHAKTGVYGKTKVREMNATLLNKYFRSTAKGYSISDDIHKMIIYKEDNLLKSGMRFFFDIIFCRNMMIYFDMKSKENAAEILFNQLKPGGYLFIGHSETLKDKNSRFSVERIGNTIAYRKMP